MKFSRLIIGQILFVLFNKQLPINIQIINWAFDPSPAFYNRQNQFFTPILESGKSRIQKPGKSSILW